MELNILEPYLWEPDKYLRNVAVDNVIFGYHDKELKVLLQKPIVLEKWTVTGGYILKTESIEDAADRIAFSRTGLKNLFFQQFRSFGNPERTVDSGFNARRINELTNAQMPDDCWIFDYFVSIGFYTLTEFSAVELKKAEIETDCAWWTVNDLPPLMFDHKLLIAEALKALRLHIAHYPIGYELLPGKFTIPEIHSLYETILGRQLDIRNFLRRLLATEIIEKLNETKSIGGHRSPFLYKFNKPKYDEGLENGVLLSF
ncbi:NUDIX hydrolase [Mucilaginibacter sp. cycad4]|uniref:NUDIX hydrolase n=1 Tax=Mucilaginibacter sp. cycad4 TaxID=3342096 RepID=UPI002AAB10DE|nr:NUDIX hydrolase [Mucilaginibacter gossypii]WPV02023.1 NUDIX hydrolase [Mucilaginibacter gossypii]